MKHCPKCNVDKTAAEFARNRGSKDGLNCWCKRCHNEYRRRPEYKHLQRASAKNYRNRHPEKLREKNRKRWLLNPAAVSAAAKIAYRIRTGQLVKQPCAVCGNPKTHAHHNDYSKPLEVRWLCASHHRQHHTWNPL